MMREDRAAPAEKLRQTIISLEAQLRSLGVDLSSSLRPLYELLKQLDSTAAFSNPGSGGMSLNGGVAAGEGGAAVGRDVLGDVLINSIKVVFAGEDPGKAQEVLARYLKWVVSECAPLRLTAIDQDAAQPSRKPLDLTSVYVDLNVDFRIPVHQSLESFLIHFREGHDSPVPGERSKDTRLASALEVLAFSPRLVLLGAPGSGKSTLTSYLALSLAEAGLGDASALDRLGKTWRHGPMVPVRVVLRKFAASLPDNLREGRASHLWDFIEQELGLCGLAPETGRLLREMAAKAGVLFLLDGLDEAGDETRRAHVFESAAEFISSAGENSRFLITARPYVWDDVRRRPTEVLVFYKLADFDREQTKLFIQRWYDAVSSLGWVSKNEVADKTRSLAEAVGREDLRPLAQNPLLLTLMATLHTSRGRLPDDRADLYDSVVELLLRRWNEPVGADRSLLETLETPSLKITDLRDVMEEVAYAAHAGHAGREGTADIPESALLDAFRPLLSGSLDKAARVVEYVENRAGLLLGQGAREKMRQFNFPHRTFQEYLAGSYLARQTDFNDRARKLALEAPYHWREVLVLGARRAGRERGVSVADALVQSRKPAEIRGMGFQSVENDWRSAIIAGEQLLELGTAAIESGEQSRAVRERVSSWLVALIQENILPAGERVRAGKVLGRIGDPRFRPDAWFLPDEPLLGFVEIQEGLFRMGTREDEISGLFQSLGGIKEMYAAESPQHKVRLPRYYIARYPVTVAQFAAFRESTKHEPGDPDSLRGGPNDPVVLINWHEALEYCGWLTVTLRNWNGTPEPLAGLLRDRGWRTMLPSVAEWEKAARGFDGRQYPWGDNPDPDRANYYETTIGAVSAVGAFPKGASPYGCLDLAGNVWEWCSSKYVPYPYRPDDGREELSGDNWRLLRGGAFNHDRTFARCAVSQSRDPDEHILNVGFRVVVPPAFRS